jgi:hypothetical protein
MQWGQLLVIQWVVLKNTDWGYEAQEAALGCENTSDTLPAPAMHLTPVCPRNTPQPLHLPHSTSEGDCVGANGEVLRNKFSILQHLEPLKRVAHRHEDHDDARTQSR